MKNIKIEFLEFIKNNTNFTQREAYGMAVLIPFIALMPFTMLFWERISSVNKIDKELTELQAEKADSLLAVLEMQQPLNRETKLAMLEIKPFDPNKLSIAQWQAMGVKPYLAKKIVNAVNKKFVFKQKNDLAKIWGFPKEEYERLKDFINLPDTVERKQYDKNEYASSYDKNKYDNKNYDNNKSENKYTSNYEKKEYTKYVPKVIEKFDINTADTATLKQIKGIGEKTAFQIEKFRNGIGGFYSLEQLKEVYILSPEAFDELKKYALITSTVRKININTADYETLKNHSYIKGKAASILLKYKKQHGNYKTLEDIKKSRAIEEDQLTKLTPYLEF
jgi:DNA uptake protein ComE-like DNA-binding protein